MKTFLVCFLAIGGMIANAEPSITGVTARQRYPWNGEVDISYTVENAGTEERALAVWAIDQTTYITNIAKSVTGDAAYTSGQHKIVWDMLADGLTFVSTNVFFAISYVESPLYCVIDLSGGTSATSYPVSYLADVPAGGWSDEYKTTKIVLRKIKAGIFTMGSRSTDSPGAGDYGLHQVTLTKDYWTGVFQVTQRQWELVMGTRPSYFNNDAYYQARPVEMVSYDMIRGSSAGAGWPNSSAVDATSFLGVLRKKSGLMLDLPTEAQWEYACRAGTTTALNSGKNLTSTDQDAEMDKVGRYVYNGGSGSLQECDSSHGTAKVGSYAQNAWGLYDLHGNVWEWCLDWNDSNSVDATDPKGPSSGLYRVSRGGSWTSGAYNCRSACGMLNDPWRGIYYCGFRLAGILSGNSIGCCSDPVRIDLMTGTRTAAEAETITYSTNWVEGVGADAIAVVAVNGEVISAEAGMGAVEWTPVRNGTYELTHTVFTNGVVAGEPLTATFVVGHFPEAPVINPASGTTFDASLTVSMACASEGATIHYTLDGTTPTMESPNYTKKFRIYGKTIIKAIAFYDDGTPSEMAVAEYAIGRCEKPVISPSDGSVFQHSGQRVSIVWEETNGVLRVTTDGSEPTKESPEYEGPFTIDETTTIKAKVFSDTWFDSEVVTATLTREWVKVATPEIEAAQTFTGSKNKVVISCATDGAAIYYTLDGSEPTTSSLVYEKPFCVGDSCTIRAKAVRYDYVDSDVAEKEIAREWGIGQTMGKPDHSFETGGDEGFMRVVDETAALGESMKSGEIKNSQTSILSTVVVGPGTLSFKWKTSCEEDEELHEWDHAEFVVDGAILKVLDGVTDWKSVSCDITGDGPHTVIWRYVKDESESGGEDCLWVSEYAWASDLNETQTTDVPVPYDWLTKKCSDVVAEYDSYEKVAKQKALNKRLTVEQCYVAGVDPESTTNDFTSVIAMEGGVPVITWKPDLEGERNYKVWGKIALDGMKNWEYPTNAFHRFFKVTVEMPQMP